MLREKKIKGVASKFCMGWCKIREEERGKEGKKANVYWRQTTMNLEKHVVP